MPLSETRSSVAVGGFIGGFGGLSETGNMGVVPGLFPVIPQINCPSVQDTVNGNQPTLNPGEIEAVLVLLEHLVKVPE